MPRCCGQRILAHRLIKNRVGDGGGIHKNPINKPCARRPPAKTQNTRSSIRPQQVQGNCLVRPIWCELLRFTKGGAGRAGDLYGAPILPGIFRSRFSMPASRGLACGCTWRWMQANGGKVMFRMAVGSRGRACSEGLVPTKVVRFAVLLGVLILISLVINGLAILADSSLRQRSWAAGECPAVSDTAAHWATRGV